MKLIVQIPCFNEENTLPATLADIPRDIPGIDEVEVLIVDDGSTDDTIDVALRHGVDHIVRHEGNRGLAAAFATGIHACLQHGADIIVNTDGDNQYCGADIPKLVSPILHGRSSIVIGDRRVTTVAHFSPFKKLLQRIGSYVVRHLSQVDLPDVVSGFRAYSRDAALKINVLTSFSYTVETLIQSGASGLTLSSVPVRTNAKTRESRLFKSIAQFIRKQVGTILQSYLMYHTGRVFAGLALLLAVVGGGACGLSYATGDGAVWNSVAQLSFQAFTTAVLLGLLAELNSKNRRLIEATLECVRRLETTPPHHWSIDREMRDGLSLAHSMLESPSFDRAASSRSPLNGRPVSVEMEEELCARA